MQKIFSEEIVSSGPLYPGGKAPCRGDHTQEMPRPHGEGLRHPGGNAGGLRRFDKVRPWGTMVPGGAQTAYNTIGRLSTCFFAGYLAKLAAEVRCCSHGKNPFYPGNPGDRQPHRKGLRRRAHLSLWLLRSRRGAAGQRRGLRIDRAQFAALALPGCWGTWRKRWELM